MQNTANTPKLTFKNPFIQKSYLRNQTFIQINVFRSCLLSGWKLFQKMLPLFLFSTVFRHYKQIRFVGLWQDRIWSQYTGFWPSWHFSPSWSQLDFSWFATKLTLDPARSRPDDGTVSDSFCMQANRVDTFQGTSRSYRW